MEPDALLQHAASGGAVLDLNAMHSEIGPMARRLLLAMAVLPPAAYGAHKAYQHFHGPGEEQAKEATLRRYGLRKEALSPTVRNMLLGAGIGGVAGAGVNYAIHHDEPDAGSRAARAGLGGALLGSIAGGVMTPERGGLRPPAPTAPAPKAPARSLQESTDALVAPMFAGAKDKIRAEGDRAVAEVQALRATLDKDREDLVHARVRAPVVESAYQKAYDRARNALGRSHEDAHQYASHIADTVDKAHQMPPWARRAVQDMPFEEFDRLMQDPNHVWTF